MYLLAYRCLYRAAIAPTDRTVVPCWSDPFLLRRNLVRVDFPSRAMNPRATTTGIRDSGLLDVLVPMSQPQTGIELKVVAVGSGQAIELGRRGDADLLLTHAPDAEEQFIAEGHGLERRLVMYNDFVLVGPKFDPARVSGEPSIGAAFTRIAKKVSPFVSRGDDSGTHMQEKKIWKEAGIESKGDWYFQAGSGMAQTLRIASERGAYTRGPAGDCRVWGR